MASDSEKLEIFSRNAANKHGVEFRDFVTSAAAAMGGAPNRRQNSVKRFLFRCTQDGQYYCNMYTDFLHRLILREGAELAEKFILSSMEHVPPARSIIETSFSVGETRAVASAWKDKAPIPASSPAHVTMCVEAVSVTIRWLRYIGMEPYLPKAPCGDESVTTLGMAVPESLLIMAFSVMVNKPVAVSRILDATFLTINEASIQAGVQAPLSTVWRHDFVIDDSKIEPVYVLT